MTQRRFIIKAAHATLTLMSRFDLKQIKSLAGEAAFARGADYTASDAVNIIMADASGIHAVVQGSEAELDGLHIAGRVVGKWLWR